MKRLVALAASMLLLMGLLSACGQPDSPAPALSGSHPAAKPAGDALSPYQDEDFSTEYLLSAEWPTYAPSVTQVEVLLENLTDREIRADAEFTLEAKTDAGWVQLPSRKEPDPAGQTVAVPAHDTAALSCDLSVYDTFRLTDGARLRIVKTVEEQICAAELLWDAGSPISAETPCGFVTLDRVPRDYTRERAGADGCVVYPTGEDAVNPDAVDVFLAKSGRNMPCQMRIVRFTVEGAAVIEDVIYEKTGSTGRFSYQRDDSRDSFSAAPGITPIRHYGYLVTDGFAVYLSDSPQWSPETAEDSQELFYGQEAAPFIEAVQVMTDARDV